MKRFVDLRHSGTQGRFAFWDTVVDKFEEHGGSMGWETWEEFAEDYKGCELDRYRHLCPKWVFGSDDPNKRMFSACDFCFTNGSIELRDDGVIYIRHLSGQHGGIARWVIFRETTDGRWVVERKDDGKGPRLVGLNT